MKIAITSVSGQLGKTIASRVINETGINNVIGLARTPSKAEDLGITVRKGDYNQMDQLKESLKGIDVVLLISGNDKPENRIDQHRNVIQASIDCGVRKIVYTSIVGAENNTSFSPVVQSNRQTEEDVKNSGLAWAIGRNGIYIEPDLEYIPQYIEEGGIRNSAGEGKCSYTSREELSKAYLRLLLEDKHNGDTFNLTGISISQSELAQSINHSYGTSISYHSMSVEEYQAERKAALGEFMGTVIAGIYEGIRNGANDVVSDYERATGVEHLSPIELIENYKATKGIDSI